MLGLVRVKVRVRVRVRGLKFKVRVRVAHLESRSGPPRRCGPGPVSRLGSG